MSLVGKRTPEIGIRRKYEHSRSAKMQSTITDPCKLILSSGFNDATNLTVDGGDQAPWWSVVVDSDTAVSLIATLSEDPTSWNELISFWPRYRIPVVLQELSELLFESQSPQSLVEQLATEEIDWLLVDFTAKRLATSPGLSIQGHNRVFDLFSDDQPDKRWPLSIHLPPWWDLQDAVKPNALLTSIPTKKMGMPLANRSFLLGQPLVEFLAERILSNNTQKVREIFTKRNLHGLHSLTVEIHRDWLMTKRVELNGLMPRQMLHGAHRWIGNLIEAQTMRALAGCPLVALPTEQQQYEQAPMGDQEVIIYFDLCRHLIDCGWSWLAEETENSTDAAHQRLVQYLLIAKEEFLNSPFESGASPSFIIECSRRRVPRSSEIRIEGMDEQEPKEHIIDCDCPLCNMMADGSFGPSFCSLDGHQLELDEEFAFSLFETREQWEEESLFFSDSEDSDDDEGCDEDDDEGDDVDNFTTKSNSGQRIV
jgi:hypothetical protein